MLLTESLLGTSSASAPVYVEDVFSTNLYTGTGATQAISNNIALGNGATTAGWIASSVDDVYADKNKNIYSTTIDTSGNIYVVGSYSKSTTYLNLYVAKLNSAGVVQWQRSIGDTGAALGYAVAVDSSGNVYACGTSAVIATGTNAFIVKYNASGTLQWQRKLGNNGGQIAYGLALDSSANVYICGDGGIIGSDYYFLTAKYNTSGTLQWQRKIAATTSGNQISANAIVVDASGNAYVTGQETVSAGVYNTITVKYNTSGTLQWQKRLNSSRGNLGRGIALDSTGSNVYVSGVSDNVTTGNDTMLVKYNSSGTLQWQRRASGASASGDSLYGICVDTSDNVYVAGQTGSSAISLLLMKYNSSGTLQFQKSLRDNTANTYGYSIATNSTDSLFLAGFKRDTSTLYYNSVLAKVAIDGTANGGYGDYTYSTTTLTDVAGTLTDSTSTLTESANSLTASTGTATETTIIVSYTYDTIPSGTGKGGLVWLKGRSGATDHALYDTTRGATFDLVSNSTAAQTTQSTGLTSFDGNGFSIGSLAKINTGAATYTSWTFRKQAKFFDVVTYTGNGANRTISHNLGSVPGCIIVKRTDVAANWAVQHRSLGSANFMLLNLTQVSSASSIYWNNTDPTSTVFTVGTGAPVNASGGTYVAYLFAHDAGGFGVSGSDNVISCGSYTGNGSATGPVVTLGYEPQWLLVKRATTSTGNWSLFDSMRGLSMSANPVLLPNSSAAETAVYPYVNPTATGFQIVTTGADFNASGDTYIYIAIRRGPMKTPTSGTSVYNAITRTGTGSAATVTGIGFPPDMVMSDLRVGPNGYTLNRLAGFTNTASRYLVTPFTNSESGADTTTSGFLLDGTTTGTISITTGSSNQNVSGSAYIEYFFRRAPGFFDVVCYTGDGTSSRQITHGLQASPELIIIKNRSSATSFWNAGVFNSSGTRLATMALNQTSASGGVTNYFVSGSSFFNSTSFNVISDAGASATNLNGSNYVAYLFATVAGVSKVFSYTGNGSSQTINCGFTGGARFVLIKRTDSTGDWYVWDSARGIVAANDPHLSLNSTAAEVTTDDSVDTDSSGFIVNQLAATNINVNAATYIGLAIA